MATVTRADRPPVAVRACGWLLVVAVGAGCTSASSSPQPARSSGVAATDGSSPSTTDSTEPGSTTDVASIPPSSPVKTESLTPSTGFDHLSASETASALVDPSQVQLGLWSLLDHLGIGVYTGGGKQVLAGSERSEKDFWLYDFEVPVLARMATARAIPFSEYADYLHAHGVTATIDEILSGYASAYAKHPDAFLVQLFDALKVQFSGAPSISPLTEWLLLVDATVSPNGQPEQGSSLGGAAGLAPVGLRQQAPCSISGDGRPAGFGIARSESEAIAIVFLEAVAELPAQAILVANAIEVSVISDPSEVHEGHDGPGARESVDATAQIGTIPEIIQCGFLFPQLTGDLISLGGPLAGVKLTWTISPEARDHGTLDVGGGAGAGAETTSTDRSGRSHVSFETRQEPSKGKGDEHDLTATVFVTADVRPALLAAHLSRALVDLVPSPVPVRGTATFRISWHDDAQHWTGTMTSSANETVTGDNIGLVCSGTWTTALSLTIATDGNITGTAVAAIDGPPACQGTPYTTQMEMFNAPITGTATDTELRFQLGTPSSYAPAGSADFTALTATIYGADPSGTTFTVPITSPGHAQGAQPLQFGDDASGKFTSENAFVLDCATC